MTHQQPYFSLYSHALRENLSAVTDKALRVFMTLGTYIDSKGWCFPGVRELSAQTGYRVEDIQDYLDELAAVNWIRFVRRNERDPMTGNKLANIYELHPDLVAVRTILDEQLEADAARSKTEGEAGSRLIQEQPETRITPDPDLAEVSDHNQHQNQNQLTNSIQPTPNNQHQQTNPALKRDDPIAAGRDETTEAPQQKTPVLRPVAPTETGSGQSARSEKQKRKPTAPDGARTLSPLPPSPAESLAEYANPLPDGEAEALVDMVCASVGNMTTPNARRLVAKYGTKQVRAGLNVLGAQADINNPGGFLRFLLEKYAVDPDRDGSMRKAKDNTEKLYNEFSDDSRRVSRDPRDFVIS